MKNFIVSFLLTVCAPALLAQPRIYLTTTNGVYAIPLMQLGGVQWTNLLGAGLTNDNGRLRLDPSMGGGDVILATNQIFTGSNQFTKALIISNGTVTVLHLLTPGGISSGFTGGRTVAEAQTNLSVVPGVHVQEFSLPLLRTFVALAADGDMPYRAASGVTNLLSTAAGRALLSAATASNQVVILGALFKTGDTLTGPLRVPYVPYSPNWTNLTSNGVPTWRAVAEVLENPSIGNYVTSVDTNLEVVAAQLRLTNKLAGAAGFIVRKSQLSNLAAPGTNSVIIDVFTNATGTWNKDANAKLIQVLAWGAGGGGGSGTKGTNAGTGIAGGGAGGAGGGLSEWIFHTSELPSSLNYTNGAGGAGGAAQTTNNTAGVPGFPGGDSYFGTYMVAAGGLGGVGGVQTGSSTTTAAGTNAMYTGGTGGQGAATGGGVSGATVNNRKGGASGGGGGGGYRAAASITNGPAAGAAAYSAVPVLGGSVGTVASPNGGNGTSWNLGVGWIPRTGSGAGGGYPSGSGSGSGGSGGWPGGGGGGGAGTRTGNSGAGGAGAQGVVVVIQYL